MKTKLLLTVSIIFVSSVIYAQVEETGSSVNAIALTQQKFPGTLGDQSSNKKPLVSQEIPHKFIGEAQRFLQYGQVTNRQNPWNKSYQSQPVQVIPVQGVNRQNPWQIGTGAQNQPMSQNGGRFPFTPGSYESSQGYTNPYSNFNQYGQGYFGGINNGYGQPFAGGFWPNMNGFGGNNIGFPSFPVGLF